MTVKRPVKTTSTASATEIRRVAVISGEELNPAAPLCDLLRLKRKVNQFDLLEVSNHGQWVTAVAAITNAQYRKLFQGSNMDRIRFRYAVYGWSDAQVTVVKNDLTTALP